MTTGSNSGTERRMLDPSNAVLDGQARVNAEIFAAVEILGRKLERVEGERDRLARRLALIESSATVDEKTGKLYLPALVQQTPARTAAQGAPKWMVSATVMSSAVALFALGLVLFREPAPTLTKEQVALLESLRTSQFTQLSPDSKSWKSLASEDAAPENAAAAAAPAATVAAAPAITPPVVPAPVAQTAAVAVPPAPAASAQLPSPSELEKFEQTAETPKPVTVAPAPVIADASAPVPLTKAEKTATAAAPAVNPQEVDIPGEDEAPVKATAKAAKNEAAKNESAVAHAQDEVATKGVTTVVPTSDEAGGLTPDTALPKKLATLQKRAYQGIPEAQHDLATIYAAGTAVPQDYHRAAFWFTKAADGGVANANYNMGVIYHQGLGVPVDMGKALEWYAKAAELGHPEAMYNLGIAYIEGIGTKTDIDKGVSYFKRASKAGVTQAAYNLGVLYESNFIGKIDTQKAIEWYKVAAKAGHGGAKDALARLQNGSTDTTQAADSGDQAQTLANKVEPSAGGDEETGEGDSSPAPALAKPASDGPHTLLADIQRILIKQGTLPGRPDGVLSQQTEDAIRSSEKKFSLTEDGQPSQELLEKLLQSPPTADKQFP
jgi:TPR repeat protein